MESHLVKVKLLSDQIVAYHYPISQVVSIARES